MRFFYFFISVGFFFSSGLLFSQTTLPNMDFEDWTSYGGGAYEEPSGGVWTTANKSVLISSLIPVATEKTTDAVSGLYAAKMTTKMASPPISMLITGTLATGEFNELATPPANLKLGKPFTGRPLRFTGYFKYLNNNGDSCDIYATLSKWDGSARQTVGKANYRSSVTVSDYTKFDLPFVYYSADTPDSISVVFASSAAGDQMLGYVGSTLYIDSIGFAYPVNITETAVAFLQVQCFPVPAETELNFILERNLTNGNIKIFNELGGEVQMLNCIKKEFSIPLNNYTKGKYFYQIIENRMVIYSGNFLID
jgi:hypothetical protein